MAQPTVLSGTKLLILVGDGGSPESFTAPCGITTTGIGFAAASQTTVLANCADPDGAPWEIKDVTSLSAEVSGAGVMAVESFDVWNDWFQTADIRNVQIKLNDVGYWAGAFGLSSLKYAGQRGQKVTLDVTLINSGPVTWVTGAALLPTGHAAGIGAAFAKPAVLVGVGQSVGIAAANAVGSTAASPILDGFSATGAYSTRLLRTAYAGKCVNVRRSSDNTTQDIGFSGGVLDTTSLLSFTGGGDGFVTRWYDQSGNAFDFSQATAANQPQIVASGAVIKTNGGAPGILFLTANATKLTSVKTVADLYSASAWTALASVKVTDFGGAATSSGTNGNFICDNAAYFGALGLGGVSATGPYIGKFSSYLYNAGDHNITVNAATKQDLVIASRLSSGNFSLNLNGTGIATTGSVPNIGSTTGTLIEGTSYSGGAPIDSLVSELINFNTALSDPNLATIATNMGVYAGSGKYGGVAWAPSKIYLAEGDSITAGDVTGYVSYVSNFAADGTNSATFSKVLNYSVGSSTANNGGIKMTDRAAAVDAQLASTKSIISVLIGVNDQFVGVPTSSFLTDLAAYCDARRSAGWKLIICTLTPSTDAGFAAWRATVNTAISGWVGVHADALCNFAADPTIGPDAAASNATYYSDGVHPTLATQTIMKGIITPVITGL